MSDYRLVPVEPTDRELSAFAVGIEAGHKVVWVHDPQFVALREAARMALREMEAAAPLLEMYPDEYGDAINALREALGDKP